MHTGIRIFLLQCLEMAFRFVTEKACRPVPSLSAVDLALSCLLRNFRSSSSSLLLPSFPLLSQLFSCNKWHISSSFSSQKPGGPLCFSLTSSLQSRPSHPPVLSPKYAFSFFGERIPLHSLPGTHCVEQASFEFVMISLLLYSKARNYRWHNHA